MSKSLNKGKGGGDKSNCGRKRDPVWSNFVVLVGGKQARCKQCSELVSAKIERIKAHENSHPPNSSKEEEIPGIVKS